MVYKHYLFHGDRTMLFNLKNFFYLLKQKGNIKKGGRK